MITKVVLCSDIMQHQIQHELEFNREYSYENIFSTEIEQILISGDLTIGNLETTISDKRKPSGFPKFSAPSKFLDALEHFDVLITTNNHMNDYGVSGLIETKNHVLDKGFFQVGLMGQNYLILTDSRNNAKYVIHALSHLSNVPLEDKILMNMEFGDYEINDDEIGIVYVHTGTEYSTKETINQKYANLRAKTRGYTACVMIHSHVLGDVCDLSNDSKYFVTNGLGNMISHQENLDRQIGRIIELDIEVTTKKIIKTTIHNTETIIKDGKQQVILLNSFSY